ncbi:MAG TPA: hypothetical protein PLR50_01665, partial [Candidatus Rifleibacterium sp.]|nr:hypothetical protein [Candidatus Rifleibacterium sp.]
MSNKKILLPESNIKERSRGRSKPVAEETAQERRAAPPRQRAARGNTRTMPMVTDIRQRNEAVGLVLVGISAFSLSLIHYISSSKIPGIINATMIYLGVGVYILPVLVGLMGIQRFLERPFQNLAWRLAGCFGVMTFGLGLLGLEGGKVGVHTFELFAGVFGPVPSKILFVSLVLSSLIFALDILYKDVLAATLVIASLLTRLAFFTWEVTLSLLSMLIGAVKTTGDLIAAVVGRIKKTWEEQEIDPEGHLGKLLSFRPRVPAVADELCEEAATAGAPAAYSRDEEEATIIPEPKCWQEEIKGSANHSPTPPVSEKTAVSGLAGVSVQVATFASECIYTPAPAVDAGAAQAKPVKEETGSDEELQVLVRFEDEEYEEEDDDDEDDVDSEDCEELGTGNANGAPGAVNLKSGVQTVSRETNLKEEPVYLDDNPIDHELKKEVHEKRLEKVNRHADAQLPPLELLKVP